MSHQDLKTALLTKIKAVPCLLLFLLATLVYSCEEDSLEKTPSYVLSEDSFASLLVDLSLAEGAVSMNVLNVRGNQIDSVYAFDPLREHNISQSLYDSTLSYYTTHPEQYKSVYQKVLTRLSALESARRATLVDSSGKE